MNGKHMHVKCIETGKVFYSTLQAAAEMGLSQSTLAKQIVGKLTHCRGYHFELTKEIPTELKRCACGKMFIPNYSTENKCENCRKQYHDPAPNNQPFSNNTRIMMVVDFERGKGIDRVSKATGRTKQCLAEELARMEESGEYDRIRKSLSIDRRVFIGISHTDEWAHNGAYMEQDSITQGA